MSGLDDKIPAPERPIDCIVEADVNEAMFEVYDMAVLHERRIALHDLLSENKIRLWWDGPYKLCLTRTETRIILKFTAVDNSTGENLQLSISRIQRQMIEYRRLCDAYFEAIRGAPVERIETLDMARRGMHNDSGEHMRDQLITRANMNLDTARKLYTVIVALLSHSLT